MADIRDRIVEDRGLLKRMQARLPGYKKYRRCEDLRTADNLLRLELAKILERAADNVKRAREEFSRAMDLDMMNVIGPMVNRSDSMVEKVRHAEQGYAPWISGDVRIEEDELRALYDYDLSLFGLAEEISNISFKLIESKGMDVNEKVKELSRIMDEFERSFQMRIDKVTGVAQRKE